MSSKKDTNRAGLPPSSSSDLLGRSENAEHTRAGLLLLYERGKACFELINLRLQVLNLRIALFKGDLQILYLRVALFKRDLHILYLRCWIRLLSRQEFRRPFCLFYHVVHKLKGALRPNAGTERCGRPSASPLATEVARPHSLQ